MLIATCAVGIGGLGSAAAADRNALTDPGMSPALMPQAQETLFLEVIVNDAATGLIAMFERDPEGRFSSPASELVELGIDAPPGDRLVALDAIASLDYRYDPLAQRIEIDAAPEALLPQMIGPLLPDAVAADPSSGLALNYDASLRMYRDVAGEIRPDGPGLALDGWVFTPWGWAGTRGYAYITLGSDPRTDWVRYDSVLQHDAVDRALTFRAGDVIGSSPSWGRSVRLGGVQVQKDFSLRRDLVTAPMLSYAGMAAVPSTVDVFLDGAPVYSGSTEPGRFEIDNVPIRTGPGTAVVTLRGADGRTESRELAFFGARRLLGRGISDYSIEVGQPRLNYGSATTDYLDETAVSATLRFGATDEVTLSAHVEGMDDLAMAGVGAEYVAGRRAEVSISAGASHDGDRTGHFGEVTFSAYPLGRLSLDASLYRSFGDFADLAFGVDRTTETASEALHPPSARDLVSLGYRGTGHSLGLNYIRLEQEGRRHRLASLSYARAFDRVGGTLTLSGGHDFEQDEDRFAVLFSLTKGRRTRQLHLDHEGRSRLHASRAIDERPGATGYAVQATRDGEALRVGGQVERETRFGRATGQIASGSGFASSEIAFRGAIAVLDRRLAAGRQIHDSFAVVDAGRAGLPIRLQNREVARTGPGGHALVSGLTSYHVNSLSMDVDDLPGDTLWSSTATDIVPARRSGIAVDFGISDVTRSRLVTLVDATGAPLALGTPVRIDGRPNAFAIGYDGQVLLQDTAPGSTVEASHDARNCRATLPPVSMTTMETLPCL